ncbi:hypothetical protein ACOKW7_21965 [Limnospira platensis CENA597]|uniref:hypothetical protein n=1 Tax=Limnospira platensis TaxID=118562 RepID=UPI003DA0295D
MEILAKEKTTSDELIKRLVQERWLSLQPRQTIVERLGGHPEHLLEDAPPDLSERTNRKKAMSNYEEILHQAQTLTSDEQKLLLKDLATLVSQGEPSQEAQNTTESPRLNLNRWRGFLPKRVDALKFQLKLRQEWDAE